MPRSFRRIPIGADAPNAVTVGIERNGEGRVVAAVWWPAVGDVDADEASYDSVEPALLAAEYSRALHGFGEVVITLQSDDLWDTRWGTLTDAPRSSEPMADLAETDLTDDEALDLARGIEAERDA